MAKSKRIRNGVGMIGEFPAIVPVDGRLTEAQVTQIVDMLRTLAAAINGRLTFGDGTHSSQSGNIDGQIKEMYLPNRSVDYEVPHGLGRVPIGIILLHVEPIPEFAVEVSGSSRGSWNEERIFIQTNTDATTVRFVIV